ncbi:hypothetical protein KIN20_035269 [Parelaphostrongylus tenuis]|uniref:Uncharacterized protein n=1 Tax=Parelaphostrongylus tenuis TaxID=148309 RepID=A0AAD5RBH4_PARTN|nr:hypothetical protein KIN20_035269 [Parelaphostrongylus tenuis]
MGESPCELDTSNLGFAKVNRLEDVMKFYNISAWEFITAANSKNLHFSCLKQKYHSEIDSEKLDPIKHSEIDSEKLDPIKVVISCHEDKTTSNNIKPRRKKKGNFDVKEKRNAMGYAR